MLGTDSTRVRDTYSPLSCPLRVLLNMSNSSWKLFASAVSSLLPVSHCLRTCSRLHTALSTSALVSSLSLSPPLPPLLPLRQLALPPPPPARRLGLGSGTCAHRMTPSAAPPLGREVAPGGRRGAAPQAGGIYLCRAGGGGERKSSHASVSTYIGSKLNCSKNSLACVPDFLGTRRT